MLRRESMNQTVIDHLTWLLIEYPAIGIIMYEKLESAGLVDNTWITKGELITV
jgi:hypothetical protein